MSTPVTEALPLPFTAEKAREFMLAGNATFTAVSEETGTRFTYKVSRARDEATRSRDKGPQLWFVGVMTGPDNEADYQYIGIIRYPSPMTPVIRDGVEVRIPQEDTRAGLRFEYGRKSRISQDAPSVKAFQWLAARMLGGHPTPKCSVYHAGSCGRCGRKLTVPESIISGYGPECIAHV